MCFGGSPKPPSVTPAPTPSPTPTVSPSSVSPMAANDSRRKRLESLRMGIASTIRTGPKGVTGNGSDLTAPSLTGKTMLG